MPRGGDHYSKYENKRRTDGRLVLDNQVDELICNLIANGEPDDQIIVLLGAQSIVVTPEQIEEVRQSPLSARRISWLKKIKARDDFTPETADECLTYVKKRLVAIDKSSDTETKDKIVALRELGKLAIDERKNGTGEVPPIINNEALNRLTGGK